MSHTGTDKGDSIHRLARQESVLVDLVGRVHELLIQTSGKLIAGASGKLNPVDRLRPVVRLEPIKGPLEGLTVCPAADTVVKDPLEERIVTGEAVTSIQAPDDKPQTEKV